MNTTSIRSTIRHSLENIENEYGVEVVNARLRGSRRINADHPESDWDILFLFKSDPLDYAMIANGATDSIHAPSNPVDLHGWDIKKFGQLLSDSNPDAIDYARTATEYVSAAASEEFAEMAENARSSANLMALYHHWLSMAESQYQKYVATGEASVNRQFHVAYAVACAGFIREADGLPELNIDQLIASGRVPHSVVSILSELLEERRGGNGETEIPDIVGDIYHMEEAQEMEPNDTRTQDPDIRLINEFIRAELAADQSC